jgi:hypothetical protein
MAKESGPSILTLALIGGGAYLAYQYFFATPAATPTTPSASPVPPGPSSDALYQQIYAAATQDAKSGATANGLAIVGGQTQMFFSAWNYYTSRIGGFIDLPDYSALTSQPDPGYAITGPQYWGLMGPWLKKNKGMSGIMADLAASLYGGGR